IYLRSTFRLHLSRPAHPPKVANYQSPAGLSLLLHRWTVEYDAGLMVGIDLPGRLPLSGSALLEDRGADRFKDVREVDRFVGECSHHVGIGQRLDCDVVPGQPTGFQDLVQIDITGCAEGTQADRQSFEVPGLLHLTAVDQLRTHSPDSSAIRRRDKLQVRDHFERDTTRRRIEKRRSYPTVTDIDVSGGQSGKCFRARSKVLRVDLQ